MGAVIGEVVLGKEQGRKAWFWGALIASFPDIDVVFKYLFSPAGAVLFHRGMTHSILFLVLLTFAFGWLLGKLYGSDKSYRGWYILAGWCLFSHIFIDIFNSYSITLFWPLNTRVVFDSMGIFDGFFFLPFFAAFLSFWFLKKKVLLRKKIALIAIGIATLYLGLASANKLVVENRVRQELLTEGKDIGRVRAAPLPLTNFVWMVVAEEEGGDGFWQTSVTTFRGRSLEYSYIPKNTQQASYLENDREFKRIKHFSRGFYAIAEDDAGQSYFCDIRFPSFDFYGSSSPIYATVKYKLKVDEGGYLNLDRTAPVRKVSLSRLRLYMDQLSGKFSPQVSS